jgi:hypothetical protein
MVRAGIFGFGSECTAYIATASETLPVCSGDVDSDSGYGLALESEGCKVFEVTSGLPSYKFQINVNCTVTLGTLTGRKEES